MQTSIESNHDTMEEVAGRKANMSMIGMQPGDVVRTYADSSRLKDDFGYRPSTSIHGGIVKLYEWMCTTQKLKNL